MSDRAEVVANLPDRLLAACINVAAECPRGLQGTAHIYEYTHRQNVDHDDPLPRIWCVGPNCPREFKEMHPWHSRAMNALLDANIAYIAERKKVT